MPVMNKLLASGLVLLAAGVAQANPHSGVDSALFRTSIDTSGVFSLEGARPMARRDLSWKFLAGFAQKPLELAVPGIGGVGDTGDDVILDNVITAEVAFGFQVATKLTIGLDVATYRTNTGEGYGERGRFAPEGNTPSTGLISLRPLSNIDPSGGFEPQGLAGPLDVRLVGKYALLTGPKLAVAAMAGVAVPFGEDEMFLGDHGFVLEPRLLVDYRLDRVKATKLVLNVGAKVRERTVLEAYDPNAMDENNEALGPEDAQVVLDVGSELLAGAGFLYELSANLLAGVEANVLVPLPNAVGFGSCERNDGSKCGSIDDVDYFEGAGKGDLAAYATVGAGYRANPHVTINLMGGAGLVGARGDDFRVNVGVTWSPQPRGVAQLGRGDRDGDGIPDVSDSCLEDSEDVDTYQDDDGCPDVDNDGDGVVDANDSCVDEPEDRDDYEDADGCPERDNDGDSITDVADRCPDQAEDPDGYDDDDGCLDEDNDSDGFPDADDQCPNEAETVNGVDDTDGCADIRTATGPEEGTDRINLKGAQILFKGSTATLTGASQTLLDQVAAVIVNRSLSIRIEVHVALGTTSKNAKKIKAAQTKDRTLSQQRAQAIVDYLINKAGVPIDQVQGTGLGSTRPLGNNTATDPANERVDFIKTQQRNP